MDERISRIVDRIKTLKNVTIFSGAGISTESGLADFRSIDGIWRKVDLSKVATPEGLRKHPDMVQEFYRGRITELEKVKPNTGHEVLARWEKAGLVNGVITQNVDRLHQAAGSKNVIELHGNLREIRCADCEKIFPCELLLSSSKCDECSGLLRPNVILFGEPLPEGAFQKAERLAASCSTFFVLGSSLEVSPANFLPKIACENKGELVIINRDPTYMDSSSKWVFHSGIGETLQLMDSLLSKAD